MTTPNLSAITTVTPKVLAAAQLASGEVTAYTVPASKAAKLATCTITNVSVSSVVVSMSVVPSGGTASTSNRILSGFTLVAGDSIRVDDVAGMWMGDSDFISINSGAATSIDVVITGLEFT